MAPLDPVINIPGLGAVRSQVDNQLPAVRFLNLPYSTVTKRWHRTNNTNKPRKSSRHSSVHGSQPSQKQSNWANILPILRQISDQMEDRSNTTQGRPEIQINIYASSASHEEPTSSSSWSSTLEKFMPIPILIWIQGSALLSKGSGLGHHGRDGGPTLALPSFTFKTTTFALARTLLIKRI